MRTIMPRSEGLVCGRETRTLDSDRLKFLAHKDQPRLAEVIVRLKSVHWQTVSIFKGSLQSCTNKNPRLNPAGVILVRFHSRARHAKPATVVEAVAKLGSRLRDAFAVVEPGRVRISGRP